MKRRCWYILLASAITGCKGEELLVGAETSVTFTLEWVGPGTGRVRFDGGGDTCETSCTRTYPRGAQVRLTAEPDSSAAFVGWAGPCSGTDPCVLIMDEPRLLRASFALEEVTISVLKFGNRQGRVISSPPGVDCGDRCAANFSFGSRVSFEATPFPGSAFTEWAGACTGTSTCSVVADEHRNVGAGFELSIPDELCNAADDDGDGLVDEGRVFGREGAERFSHVARSGNSQFWWMGVGPTALALSWMEGIGTMADVIRVQVADHDGVPVGDPVSISSFQPSNSNAVVWMGDRFMIVGSVRGAPTGYCRAEDGNCVTYAAAISASGRLLYSARQLMNDGPNTGGYFALGGELIVTHTPPAGGKTIVRSFTSDAEPGHIDGFLPVPRHGETIGAIRGLEAGDVGYWVFNSSTQGVTLLRTWSNGQVIDDPVSLRDRPARLVSSNGAPAVVLEDILFVAFREEENIFVGRWDLQGRSLGEPTLIQLSATDAHLAADASSRQVALVTNRDNIMFISRISVSGSRTQEPAALFGTLDIGVAAPPGRILVAGSNYGGNEVSWWRLGCR